MAKTTHDLVPGTIFISDKIQITIIEIKDGSVDVLVVKPGKPGSIKNWSHEKFLKKTKDLKIIPMNSENGDAISGHKNNQVQDLQFKGAIIKAKDLLLKMHPVNPNEFGIENCFIFAIDEQGQKMLVGESPKDSRPLWVDAQLLLNQIPEEYLISMAVEEFEAESIEELEEKATEIFKKLGA